MSVDYLQNISESLRLIIIGPITLIKLNAPRHAIRRGCII